MYPCTCVRVNEFRFDCSRKFYDRWKTICWNVALFRDAVELRETEMSEINDARQPWRTTVRVKWIRRTVQKNQYLQSTTTNSCEQKTREIFHHHVRPSRLRSVERAWWVKTALPTFLSLLRRSESISLYRIYHIHVYFSKHTEIRSTLR